MEDLRKTLITPAWAELKQDDSKITKLITHEIFATKNGDIDIEKLILFGLLEAFGFVLFSVYWNGFVIALHTIMETNINKFRVFKNNNIDSSTIQLVE